METAHRVTAMGTHSQLPADRLHNNLKALRLRLGLNQQELARRAGVTRQTISGVESGLYLPSTLVALRLARALGCRVEDLLWLEEETASLDVVPAASVPVGCASRLLLARVGDRWIAHPLSGDQTLRTELLPADAEGRLEPGHTSMPTRLLEDVDTLAHTVVVAGCTPALRYGRAAPSAGILACGSTGSWPTVRQPWRALPAARSTRRAPISMTRTVQSTTFPSCGGSCRTVRLFSSRWASGKKGSWSAQAIHAMS